MKLDQNTTITIQVRNGDMPQVMIYALMLVF